MLSRSIDSILEQTHGDFELIINDDCSCDNTAQICMKYVDLDPRIKYFKNEKNLQYAENQNAAIGRAKSDYVAIVHDGDIYRKDLIEHWTQALVRASRIGLVFNQYKEIRPDGREVIYDEGLPEVSPGKKFLNIMLSRKYSPIFGIVMVRKSALLKVGPFDNRFSTLADIDMWMRLLANFDVAYITEPLIEIATRETGHHNNPGNLSVRKEFEHIYFLNLARVYELNDSNGKLIFATLKKNILKRNLHSILWCIRRGKFSLALEWTKFTFICKERHNSFWKEGLSEIC